MHTKAAIDRAIAAAAIELDQQREVTGMPFAVHREGDRADIVGEINLRELVHVILRAAAPSEWTAGPLMLKTVAVRAHVSLYGMLYLDRPTRRILAERVRADIVEAERDLAAYAATPALAGEERQMRRELNYARDLLRRLEDPAIPFEGFRETDPQSTQSDPQERQS